VRQPRAALLALGTALLLSAASFTAGLRVADGSLSGRFQEVVEAAEQIQGRSAFPVSDAELVHAAIRGMLAALGDPYADLLGPQDLSIIEELVDGSIVGIGVWLERGKAGLRVSAVVADSPAESSGIRGGDVIVSVDGQAVAGLTLDEVAQLITGRAGTSVHLGILREGERLEFDVIRARIGVSDVQARIIADDVAYARVLQFGGGASQELRRALEELLEQGADGIVLDLRDNPGGVADEAIDVASLFIEDGLVARLRERGQPERPVFARGEALPELPLVVLVNGGTASAAEVVAGALQDRDRATLIGTPTFGKGAVLTLQELHEGEAIQFTTAEFLTADGHLIEGHGISPDWPLLPGGPGDAQLRWALKVLRGTASR
jgi:carboxyl-terminal processing protease